MREQVALIPDRIAEGVAERTAELEKVCERERQIAELRLDEYNKLTGSYNRLLKKSQNDKNTYEFNLSQRDYAIAILKAAFQKAVELLDVVCRKALQAVIDFAKKPIAKRFTYEQTCAVNEFLDTDTTDNMLQPLCLYYPTPFSRKTNTPKGDWKYRTWLKTIPNMKGLK